MEHLLGFNWAQTLEPHAPIPEIILRGTLTYLVLFLLLRVIPKRETGAAGITDLLVVVLIADAAQNAMADNYTSVADGVVLVATIVFWAWALNWLGFRFPAIGKMLSSPPLPLVRNGRLLRRNMRRELVTEDELMSQLRLQGLNSLSAVKEAVMESDGRISIVPTDDYKSHGAREKNVG